MSGAEVLRAIEFGSGISVRGSANGRSTGVANRMLLIKLDTSLYIRLGRVAGRSLPEISKLHKYRARANSGKRRYPDFVVSESSLVA